MTIDIEGFEIHLANPRELPGLAQGEILIEVHSSPPLGLAAGAGLSQPQLDLI